jgi:hypothetical protein
VIALVIALVILVFLDAADAGTPLPETLARAAEQALGPGAKVAVRAVPGPVLDRELIEAGKSEAAAAVARLTWVDARRSQAHLEVHVLGGGERHMTETLTFDATDPLGERGRAIGLVLASLLAPAPPGPPQPPQPPEPAQQRRPGDEAHAQSPPEARARAERPAPEVANPPAAAAAVTTTSSPPASPPSPTPRPPWFLDAAAEGGIAVGGAGSGLGAALGLGRRLTDRLDWRIGVRARFGDVGPALASVLSAGLSGGLGFTMRRARDGERLELDLRLDALLLYEALSHFSSDDEEPVRRGRIVPGASLAAGARYVLGPGAAVFLGAGPELAFGRTDVVVHLQKVAELAPLRVSIQGGLRMTF